MKVRVGNRRVPANHDVVTDSQFHFAEQHGVGEVAVIADHDSSVLAEGEVNAVHGAVGANDQRLLLPAVKSFEGQVTGDDRVAAGADIRRQGAVRPPAWLEGFWRSPELLHRLPPSAAAL